MRRRFHGFMAWSYRSVYRLDTNAASKGNRGDGKTGKMLSILFKLERESFAGLASPVSFAAPDLAPDSFSSTLRLLNYVLLELVRDFDLTDIDLLVFNFLLLCWRDGRCRILRGSHLRIVFSFRFMVVRGIQPVLPAICE